MPGSSTSSGCGAAHVHANPAEHPRLLGSASGSLPAPSSGALAFLDIHYIDVATADMVLEFADGRSIPCHTQILSAWSSVLRDVLASCTPCRSDGLLHLPIGGDDARDWAWLLGLMYPPCRLPRPAVSWVRGRVGEAEEGGVQGAVGVTDPRVRLGRPCCWC